MTKHDQVLDEMSLFEKASFYGITYSTVNGIITVDTLWRLPIVHDEKRPHVANLTEILALYKSLSRTTLPPARCNNELAVEVLEAVIKRLREIKKSLISMST
jgi:hypothetical protein